MEINEGTLKHQWYIERKERGSTVDFKTVVSRLSRKNDMMRSGRTIDELFMTPKSSKIVTKKGSGPRIGYKNKELYELYQINHHPSVDWRTAIRRKLNGWNDTACCMVSMTSRNKLKTIED